MGISLIIKWIDIWKQQQPIYIKRLLLQEKSVRQDVPVINEWHLVNQH